MKQQEGREGQREEEWRGERDEFRVKEEEIGDA